MSDIKPLDEAGTCLLGGTTNTLLGGPVADAPVNSLKRGHCNICGAVWTTADVTLRCPNGCAKEAFSDYVIRRKKETEAPSNWGDITPPVFLDPLKDQRGGEHYRKLKFQPTEYIQANNLGWCEGNVVKYVTRWKDKDGLQDLEKALHYLEILIELEKKKNGSS